MSVEVRALEAFFEFRNLERFFAAQIALLMIGVLVATSGRLSDQPNAFQLNILIQQAWIQTERTTDSVGSFSKEFEQKIRVAIRNLISLPEELKYGSSMTPKQ